MRHDRRTFLKTSASFGTVVVFAGMDLLPIRAAAAGKTAFDAQTMDDVVKALGGAKATESAAIQLKVPSIAENGAVVPVEATSELPKTEYMAILVEKNPRALSASFTFPAGTEPFISTRVKVGETSDLIVLVKTDKGFFYTKKLVKVTLGGCGG